MAGMGYVSRAYHKLPDWMKLALGILCCGVPIPSSSCRIEIENTRLIQIANHLGYKEGIAIYKASSHESSGA